MIINPIYNYGTLKREDGGPDGRKYVLPDGTKTASVTSILSATKDMTYLHAWRKRIGKDKAQQITTESANLGTTVHSHLECHVLGKDRPGGNNYGRMMAARMADVVIDQGLVHVDEIWGSEVQVYFENLWAGSSDVIGLFKGVPSIIDFKNTIKPKKIEWVEDYFLQTVAYAMAHNNMFGTDIKQCVIFMVSRDCDYQEFIVDNNRFDHYKLEWCKRVDKYYS
jgi:genome maintenance exonuclease 1